MFSISSCAGTHGLFTLENVEETDPILEDPALVRAGNNDDDASSFSAVDDDVATCKAVRDVNR